MSYVAYGIICTLLIPVGTNFTNNIANNMIESVYSIVIIRNRHQGPSLFEVNFGWMQYQYNHLSPNFRIRRFNGYIYCTFNVIRVTKLLLFFIIQGYLPLIYFSQRRDYLSSWSSQSQPGSTWISLESGIHKSSHQVWYFWILFRSSQLR